MMYRLVNSGNGSVLCERLLANRRVTNTTRGQFVGQRVGVHLNV
jgi:hypothetical protein